MAPVSRYRVENVRYIKAAEKQAIGAQAAIEDSVKTILADVKERGDAAVGQYSKTFDDIELDTFEVSHAQRQAAVEALDPQARADSEFAIAQVRSFAKAQLETIRPLDCEPLPGLHLGHRVIPIHTIGAYVPGGRYPLMSAPIMTIVPAKVAGCSEIIACLPPRAHQDMIAICHLAGADRIFRIGGAQAIAAMAFGTETVPAVDKIVGPGNAFVNEAKRQIFGPVGIDQLAGPSEIFIVADETGDARTIATDLLAQAEHDVHARAGLITTDAQLAEQTAVWIERLLHDLPTADVASVAWRDNGEIAICDDEATMLAYSDHIAAEHLQVHTRDPHKTAKALSNYGSLFVGPEASVVYSDKCCGTNHTLPTMGAARYTGGLWVGTYVKICTHQWMNQNGVKAVAPSAVRQSGREKLEGHRRAAALRLENVPGQ